MCRMGGGKGVLLKFREGFSKRRDFEPTSPARKRRRGRGSRLIQALTFFFEMSRVTLCHCAPLPSPQTPSPYTHPNLEFSG